MIRVHPNMIHRLAHPARPVYSRSQSRRTIRPWSWSIRVPRDDAPVAYGPAGVWHRMLTEEEMRYLYENAGPNYPFILET